MELREQKIKTIIVDDHAIVADGLAQLLALDRQFEVIGKATNGKVLRQMLNSLYPDLILLDISMPVLDGLQAAAYLRIHRPEIKIVLISMEFTPPINKFIKEHRINGFFIKHAGAERLLNALRAVAEGNQVYVTDKPEDFERTQDEMVKYMLTKTEVDIIRLVAKGYSTKEIAAMRKLSDTTIEKQRGTIMRKLQMKNMAEVVAFSAKNNLL